MSHMLTSSALFRTSFTFFYYFRKKACLFIKQNTQCTKILRWFLIILKVFTKTATLSISQTLSGVVGYSVIGHFKFS